MSGSGQQDELALLVASFVEELKPFFAGIRRGVAGIFAVPRDAQAIAAARGSLATIASSATVLDLPAARQLAELARLVDEAFATAERGGVPDESRQPLLTLIDGLEAQLDGLRSGDDRGRERLDNGYRLLEQVRRTVEQAEAAPAPAMELDLDDLLQTLTPVAPPAPEPTPEPEPAPEFASEPAAAEATQTELKLVSEDEIEPIEWGRKEALAWEKGAWDESKATFGNTDILFIDTDETGSLPLLPYDSLFDGPEAAPEAPAASGEAAAESPAPTEPVAAEPAAEAADEQAPAAPVEATAGDAARPLAAGRVLDATQLEEAALLSLPQAELPAFIALDAAQREAFLATRTRELAEFAADLGYTVEPPAAAAEAPAAAVPVEEAPVGEAPAAEASAAEALPPGDAWRDAVAAWTDELIAASAEDAEAAGLGGPIVSVHDTGPFVDDAPELEPGADDWSSYPASQEATADDAPPASVDAAAAEAQPVAAAPEAPAGAIDDAGEPLAAEAPGAGQPEDHTPVAAELEAVETPSEAPAEPSDGAVAPAAEEASPAAERAPEEVPAAEAPAPAESGGAPLEVAARDDAEPAGEAGRAHAAPRESPAVAAIGDVLIAEYQAASEASPDALETSDADAIMAARLYTNRLNLPDYPGEEPPPGATGDAADEAAGDADEPYESLLDSLLDDEPPAALDRRSLESATDQLFAGDGDEGGAEARDSDFAALPEVPAEIEAAFGALSEAEMMTFLTLDGDAAMEFLQSRMAARAADDAAPPVAEHPPAVDEPVAAAALPAATEIAAEAAEEALTFATPPAGLDPDILEVFLLEMQELLDAWGAAQVRLRRAPADAAAIDELRRTAHTVKGAASMMGFGAIGEIGRQVEATLDLLGEQELAATPVVLDFVERSYAALQQLSADADTAAQARPEALAELGAMHAALLAELAAIGDAGAAPAAAADEAPAPPDHRLEAPAEAEPAETDDALLEIFRQEAEEHLGGFNRALVALDRRPDDREQLAEAKRLVHTLKGAAAALGYPLVAALCHGIEDLFEALDESGRAPSRETITLCFEAAETLERLLADIAAGRGEDAGAVHALRARLERGTRRAAGDERETADTAERAPAEPGAEEVAATPERGAATARSVRVDIAHLDTLLNFVGELVINRTAQEQNLERLGRTINELLLSVERLRRIGFELESRYEVAELLRVSPRERETGQGLGAVNRHDEFDELEMDRYTELHRISRELIEAAADINAAGGELEVLHDGFDQTLARQARISTDLQDRLMEVRLVPFSSIASRLYRAVRGVAVRRSRDVELAIAGEATQVDKVVLEELTDPLLHLVRNAADHGIEDPATRRARGKPATGTIRVTASREGNEAVIRIADDGAGIDLDAVLDKAIARGYIRDREQLTREQALDLIFLPGFSTSATVSDISGRGVGLDVVRTNVARLKGTIDVDSTPGAGTTFTIRLPIMLAVTRALLVRVGAQTFAIPLPVVEQVAFFRREQVKTVGGAELFDLGGETYPIVSLARALGVAGGEEAAAQRALIVGHADRRIALVVDELVGQQEVVVKRLGRHLQSVAGVAGATILGNGQIVLILNILDLLGGGRRAAVDEGALSAPADDERAALGGVGEGERLAMVVDDSLSVRRVLSRTLERDGWTVLQAKDGVEALEMLAWARPRVLLLDIEMPRMDGYELTARLKSHPDHQQLPIMMLTSRAGEKHRRKALDLGVAAYLVKPFEEAELLRTARDLAGIGDRQLAAR